MSVKVIDWKDPDRGSRLAESFRSTGFAILTNHNIPESLIRGTYREWQRFFEEFTDEEKEIFLFNKEDQAGYFPMNSESAKDSGVADIKEFYHYYPWANNPKGFCSTSMLRSYLMELGHDALAQLEANTPGSITSKTPMKWSQIPNGAKRTLFRIIHYPPLTGNEPDGAVRAAAHGDINLLTLLPMSTASGLQVKDLNDNWHDVKHDDPSSIVVNVGDMLEEASQGYYKSTLHRVVNPDNNNERRYSMPLFIHPQCDVILSDKYTADEYLQERLKELGLK